MTPEQFVFTNGTDEAIQVFVNTYVDDGQEVLLLKPSYAMYRFYAEVAGATIREVAYPPPAMEFPLQEVLDAITPETRAVLFANPNNPTGTGISLLGIERILQRAPQGRGADGRSVLRILRHHRAHRNRTRPEPVRQPHVFQGLRHGGHAAGLPVLARGQHRAICTRRSRRTA